MRPQPPGSSPFSDQKTKRRLSRQLSAIFVFALIMGPGPGALLLRPPPGESPALVLGMPVLYVWTIFWFAVMAAVVVLAARFLWHEEGETDE